MGGFALKGGNFVGSLSELKWKGDNFMRRLWVMPLVSDTLVDRLWGLALIDEHCGVCKHTKQWCL